MKRLLIVFYHIFRKVQNNIAWFLQAILIRFSMVKTTFPELDTRKTYLLLIPHADDEWIGSSSIVSNTEYRVALCNMDMQGGDDERLHKVRRKELEAIANKYNRELYLVKDDLERIIAEVSPDVILVPYFIDWHEEHIEVMQKLYDVLVQEEKSSRINIAMYQVSLPIPDESITCVQAMTFHEWNHKWKVFKNIYKSQDNIPYMRFAFTEFYHGIYSKTWAGEVFSILSSSQWITMYNKIIPDEITRRKFKREINSLKRIRMLTAKFLEGGKDIFHE